MPIQDTIEAAAWNATHAGVATAANAAHKVVSTGLDVLATPTQVATEAGKALAVTLVAGALFWTGKKALQAGWWLVSTTVSVTASATVTATSGTYAYFFPPRPLAIEWHKEEPKAAPAPGSALNID